MREPRIWYVNVFVRDFEQAVAFYEKTLGLPLSFKNEEHGYASFATSGAGLALARIDGDDALSNSLVGRHTGIGLGVPDLEAAYGELQAEGVHFLEPPTRQAWGGTMARFADPEGNVFYLDQLRDE